MKSMNRREGKKIAVMAAVIMGLMMFAFMPLASATVTSFTVTPSTGIAGAVDSYNALVTTEGVTSINITIPKGFIAVTPTTGGVEIARVTFWNKSTKTYYGYATITANDTTSTPNTVDIYCEFGGDKITTTQDVDYTAGETNTFESGFPSDTSSAIIRSPTEAADGSIKIDIDSTAFQLEDVSIAIKQFVRNPTTAGHYDFFADGVRETVSITAAGGRGIVFRNGAWYIDTNGDHIADRFFMYGAAGDIPLVGNFGSEDTAVFRNGVWYVDTTGNHLADLAFWLGAADDIPVVGDINRDGTEDIGVFRDGVWYVNTSGADTTGSYIPDLTFWLGAADDIPVVGDIDGDGTEDIGVFRNGVWYVDTTGNYSPDLTLWFGAAGDIPVVGDINQDGTEDIGLFRNGVWYFSTDLGSSIEVFWFGAADDIPLVGDIR